jgi:hypothetical protein
MRIFLTVALCFSILMLRGQNLTAIDSLKQQLASADAKVEYELLNAIGFEYRYSFPDSTIYYCTKAYKLGRDLKLKKDLSRPLSFIGLASAYRGHYKAALEYHEKAITVAIDQQDSTQLAYGYNNLSMIK